MAPVGGSHACPLPAGAKESPRASHVATAPTQRSRGGTDPSPAARNLGWHGGGRASMSPPTPGHSVQPCREEESTQRWHRRHQFHHRFCFCTKWEADEFVPRGRCGTPLPVPPHPRTDPVPLRGESCTRRALTSARHRHNPGTRHVPAECRGGRGASPLLAGDGDEAPARDPAGPWCSRLAAHHRPSPSPSKSFIRTSLGSFLRSLVIYNLCPKRDEETPETKSTRRAAVTQPGVGDLGGEGSPQPSPPPPLSALKSSACLPTAFLPGIRQCRRSCFVRDLKAVRTA